MHSLLYWQWDLIRQSIMTETDRAGPSCQQPLRILYTSTRPAKSANFAAREKGDVLLRGAKILRDFHSLVLRSEKFAVGVLLPDSYKL